jgi:hypothetical protein
LPPSFIKDGKIVPVEVTVSLLSKAIFSSASWNFLVDGFPRNMDNFNGWFDAIGDECDVRATRCSAWPTTPQPCFLLLILCCILFLGPVCAVFHVPPKRHGAAVEAQVRHPLASVASSKQLFGLSRSLAPGLKCS